MSSEKQMVTYNEISMQIIENGVSTFYMFSDEREPGSLKGTVRLTRGVPNIIIMNPKLETIPELERAGFKKKQSEFKENAR
ncbi:MAG: hypothetical protein FWC61_03700 [Proteobacteria bacterium]|nr:hypothetical protein [Pseudomonadota bacterium]